MFNSPEKRPLSKDSRPYSYISKGTTLFTENSTPVEIVTPSRQSTSGSPTPSTMYERIISTLRTHHPSTVYRMGEGRLVDRDGPFFQSKGRMRIRKRIRESDWAAFYYGDLFHSILDAPTSRVILAMFVGYISLAFLFAVPYYIIARNFDCDMGIQNYHEAVVFSLETMATIGYGARDIYFGDCWLPFITLAAQVCVKLVADALIIGIIYSRVSRPSKRASTVVFSKFAIIRRIRGKLYFMLQLCELRKHQLVEAHIRCYAVRHERDMDGAVIAPFQTCSMRLNHPNDELGGMLLMCLPQVVVHEIDHASPLMPPPVWSSAQGTHVWHPPSMEHAIQLRTERTPELSDHKRSSEISSAGNLGAVYDPDVISRFPGVHRRSADEPLESPYRRRISVGREQGLISTDKPRSSSKKPVVKPDLDWQDDERIMIMKYMRDRRVEVVAIVEGINAVTGGVMQSRYSFSCKDIKWDMSFMNCVMEDNDGTAIVDFSLFHELQDAEPDAPYMVDAASLL